MAMRIIMPKYGVVNYMCSHTIFVSNSLLLEREVKMEETSDVTTIA